MLKISLISLLLYLMSLGAAANPQIAPSNARWVVRVAGRDNRQNKGANCHPFEYFTDSSHLKDFDYVHHIPKPYPDGIHDDIETKRRGEINGFVVYDVVTTSMLVTGLRIGSSFLIRRDL